MGKSAIHLAAKQIISERKQITIPKYTAKIEMQDIQGITHSIEKLIIGQELVIDFESVVQEFSINDFKAYLLAFKESSKLVIEIRYRQESLPYYEAVLQESLSHQNKPIPSPESFIEIRIYEIQKINTDAIQTRQIY